MNAAQEIANQSDIVVFNRDTRREKESARFTPRFLKSDDNGYVVLIDGMKDVQFYINSAKWETILAPQGETGGSKTADTIEVDGQLIITEPFGISFLEVLTNVSRDLFTEPSGLIFILKTVFVGHRADGTQEMISNIRPFLFTMTDITAVIDTGGATYTMEVVGVNNGTAKLPQISRIAQGVNLNVKSGELVSSALTRLQEEINLKYARFKQALDTQLKEANSPLSLDDFREVTYEIVADPAYSNAEYVAGDNLPVNASGTDEDRQISTGKSATVESAIRAVMSSSKQVQQDGAGKSTDGKKYIYKIVSTLVPDEVDDKLKVQYSVHRYEVIQQVVGEPLEPKEGEFIEFDYIFTGKNVDILEFDIKMDMGLSFFYTLSTADSIPITQKDVIFGKKQSVATGAQSPVGTANPQVVDEGEEERKPRTPLFLGTSISDPLIRNKANPLDTATFDALLSRHAAFENVEAAMKIAGNPQLLDETTPKPTEAEDGTINGDVEAEPKIDSTGASRIFKTPALIKVNVKFPVSNDIAISGFKDFWYQGFYNLYSITQNFEEGLFTQDIQMFSLPQTDGSEATLATAAEQETNTDVQTADQGNAEDAVPTGGSS
jgi:hypothetical protein